MASLASFHYTKSQNMTYWQAGNTVIAAVLTGILSCVAAAQVASPAGRVGRGASWRRGGLAASPTSATVTAFAFPSPFLAATLVTPSSNAHLMPFPLPECYLSPLPRPALPHSPPASLFISLNVTHVINFLSNRLSYFLSRFIHYFFLSSV